MKPGSAGQKDLRLALQLLADVEKIISHAGLNPTHTGVQNLANGVSSAKGALSQLLGATTPEPQRGNSRSMDPMKIALRVLTELAEKRRPESADLEALERICGQKPGSMGWDEFACEALQKVLGDRAAARQSLASGVSAFR